MTAAIDRSKIDDKFKIKLRNFVQILMLELDFFILTSNFKIFFWHIYDVKTLKQF